MPKLVSLLVFTLININILAQPLTIDEKVDSLLQLMTIEEKIGQMTQAERGALESLSDISFYNIGSLLSGGGSSPEINSVEEWAKMYDTYQQEALKSRLGIPLIYGIDAVHGHNNVKGAVILPHNIGLGCTRNPTLIQQINEVTAKEVAATGIDWTFSPCIAVPRNEQWGRTYEGFGETAELQKLMSAASVIGLQGDNLADPVSILACAKHFVGDGGTTDGIDQGNTEISEELLRSLHMQGYIDAIENNVGSIMASYNSWNGQKLHGYDYLLTTVLKEELGFEGFIISDWKGVDQIDEDYRIAVKRAINAGIDMVMVPDRYIYFISILKDLVSKNEVSSERIDDAVRRILKQKFLLNLFAEPLTDNSLASSVGSAEHRTVARQAVRESLVLLSAKNNVLPLHKNGQNILVSGRLANDLGAQCGGWSISWQGSNGAITEGTTILEGLERNMESSNIIYAENGETIDQVDAAIVVIGEDPYAEGAGDRIGLNIDQDDLALVKKIKSQGIPVIVILISGRPMIISELLPYTDAFIAAWLPGTEGDGVAELLLGDYMPSGLLSHTWPKHMAQIPINYGDNLYEPLFPYGYGITQFLDDQNNINLEPYAAVINQAGDQITLTLNDRIDIFEALKTNFIVSIDGNSTYTLSDIAISEFDESIILLNLNEPINSSNGNIRLTYTGTTISSDIAVMGVFDNLYVHNVSIALGDPIQVPGRVEAEDFFAMAGISTEPTTDIGGGENVGWIENGDWMEYNLDVLDAAEYSITARIAGFNGGTLNLSFNNETNAYINYLSTDGWQTWDNFTTTVELVKGKNIMRVSASTDGFNINYFDFAAPLAIEDVNSSYIDIYPNPFKNNITVKYSSPPRPMVRIGLYNLNGILIKNLVGGKLNQIDNTFELSINNDLAIGIYYIELYDGQKRYIKRLIKE